MAPLPNFLCAPLVLRLLTGATQNQNKRETKGPDDTRREAPGGAQLCHCGNMLGSPNRAEGHAMLRTGNRPASSPRETQPQPWVCVNPVRSWAALTDRWLSDVRLLSTWPAVATSHPRVPSTGPESKPCPWPESLIPSSQLPSAGGPSGGVQAARRPLPSTLSDSLTALLPCLSL